MNSASIAKEATNKVNLTHKKFDFDIFFVAKHIIVNRIVTDDSSFAFLNVHFFISKYMNMNCFRLRLVFVTNLLEQILIVLVSNLITTFVTNVTRR